MASGRGERPAASALRSSSIFISSSPSFPQPLPSPSPRKAMRCFYSKKNSTRYVLLLRPLLSKLSFIPSRFKSLQQANLALLLWLVLFKKNWVRVTVPRNPPSCHLRKDRLDDRSQKRNRRLMRHGTHAGTHARIETKKQKKERARKGCTDSGSQAH